MEGPVLVAKGGSRCWWWSMVVSGDGRTSQVGDCVLLPYLFAGWPCREGEWERLFVLCLSMNELPKYELIFYTSMAALNKSKSVSH